MENRSPVTRGQLAALASVSLISPALRLIPSSCVELAGVAAWLCPLLAMPGVLMLSAILSSLLKNRRAGEGLGGVLLRALGRPVGSVVLGLYSLWLVFYAGLVLRNGADRLVSTIYPGAQPWVFILVTLVLAFVAALGRTRALPRFARLLLPLFFLVLTPILLSALLSADPRNLLPITERDLLPALRGALSVVQLAGFMLLNVAFLEGLTPPRPGRGRRFAVWSCLVCLLLSPLAASALGQFGPVLTAQFPRPFFTVLQNTRLFDAFERVEAPVAAIWVLSDFVLAALALIVASGGLRQALGYPQGRDESALSLGNGRYLIWLCAVGALAAALLVAPTSFSLRTFSEDLLPIVNFALCFGLPLSALLVGKLRRTI